ncbi:sulfatase-like hydrolase/transferase [Planctomicrobium sp. SH664]|uniref:sulfatase-like hydrolase/transferase n=1 Tax=Planctomicrobium sp. SH664 TaxID=3448125 RepID=UPI003F5CB442
MLILADDLGQECLGCYGAASYRTPHLDQLAHNGARFTHCYSQPLCTPSRVQLLTGKYNYRNYTAWAALPPGERTFAQELRQAGYRTGITGKWQLDGWKGTGGQSPHEAGFDAFRLWHLHVEGRQIHAGSGHANADFAERDSANGEIRVLKAEDQYGPDLCVEFLIDFITKAHGSGQPFLAYYPMILPHAPYQPTPQSPEWKTPSQRTETDPRYFKGMVELMDRNVGRVVDRLDALGIREQTLILFLGDNGTGVGITSQLASGEQIAGEKGFPTDGGTHVPLIVNWKGTISPGQVCEELVDLTDFFPTLLEAAGLAPSEASDASPLDGQSILPPLLGTPHTPRESVLIAYTHPGIGHRPVPRSIAARNQRFKLYSFYEFHPGKGQTSAVQTGNLYDIQNDPLEKSPLAADRFPEIRALLQKALARVPLPEPAPEK